MQALDKKLFRDLRHIWAQVLAIAFVMAAGVMTLILSLGAYRSLIETRAAYYERYYFADVFATATRVPSFLAQKISEIEDVAALDTRIEKLVLLDIENLAEPATGRVISLPDFGKPRLNRLYLVAGRMPEPWSRDEIVVTDDFAKANKLTVGASLKAILNGRKKKLRIVGTVLSPEFIYAQGPGDFIPDPRRFAIIWMSEKTMAGIFDLEGAFNSVSIQLLDKNAEQKVIERLDILLKPYGGLSAYGREHQTSHAFLDAELTQLEAMGRILPPIFLLVSAFLVNMTLSRLIALEREQIGLLKALGYGAFQIAFHYIKFVLVIAFIGIVIGSIAGTWLGHGLTALYSDFFHFPFLIFRQGVDLYIIAALISAFAALVGAARAVYKVTALPPAEAMSPPAPERFRQSWTEQFGLLRIFSQQTVMMFRHILRYPVRAIMTMVGISLSVALLVGSLFTIDSVEFMIDVTFFQTDRQDATLSFANNRHLRALQDVSHLPGVLRAEVFRSAPVRLRNGQYYKKTVITGRDAGTDLSRIVNADIEVVPMPKSGLVVTEKLAQLLHLKLGERVEVEFLDGRRQTEALPIVQIIQSYLGMQALMDLGALNKIMREGHVISGAYISFDASKKDELFKAVKNLPAIGSISLQKESLKKFRETMAQNLNIMTTVYIILSSLIAFGVIYNMARIQLSERGRELASLRVLGFTFFEVFIILISELAFLTLLAIPIGWALGYLLASAMIAGFDSELYRIPFIIERATYAKAALVALAAAAFSAMLVMRRVSQLDMIEVLKTRE